MIIGRIAAAAMPPRSWRAGYAQAMYDVMGTLNRYRKI